MILLHRDICSKSRCALEFMQTAHKPFTVRDYVADPLSREELKALFEKLDKKPLEVIRQGEELFKELYEGKALSDEEWIEVLIEHPFLLERPILVDGDTAIVGRPPELIEAYLQGHK